MNLIQNRRVYESDRHYSRSDRRQQYSFFNRHRAAAAGCRGHDLLVEVKAISVNPVDTKVRAGFNADTPRVLGWDAVGVVKAVGSAVTLFAAGDEVWYAGALGRPGSNSEFQLVDERIVARKPRSLDNASAAALPLTAITAWELLFHRLGVEEGGNAGDTLLIVGAAGGVGSILTQLASKLTGMTVIGTASRAESQKWVREAGRIMLSITANRSPTSWRGLALKR